METRPISSIRLTVDSIRKRLLPAKLAEYSALAKSERKANRPFPFPAILIREHYSELKVGKRLLKFASEVVDGNHRLWAATKAGYDSIPVIVKALDDGGAFLAQLTENRHGLPLTDDERNRAILRLGHEFKIKLAEIGKAMNLHESSVSRILRGFQGVDPDRKKSAKAKGGSGKAAATLRTFPNDLTKLTRFWTRVGDKLAPIIKAMSAAKRESLAVKLEEIAGTLRTT